MFVKRYIAKDMSEAMERIRKDLGSEAVILSNRAVRTKGVSGIFKKKMIEVMVAYEPAPDRKLMIEPPPAREQLSRVKPQYEGKRPEQQEAEQVAALQQLNEVKKALQALQTLETPEIPPPLPPKQEEKVAVPAFPRAWLPEKDDDEEADEEDAILAPPNEAKIDELNEKLSELKGIVRDLTTKIITADKGGALGFAPEVMQIYNGFLTQDMQERIARKLCEQMQSIMERVDEDPQSVARTLLLDVLGEPAPLKLKKYQQTVIMLIGPTGVGKTTTLVKLAGMFTINQGAKVGFINTDTYRVAAQEQLRTYAEIMDIPCCTVYEPDEISLALKELGDRDVILIDTAGKSTGDRSYYEDIAAFAKESRADEILLTISASMSHHACEEMIHNFSFLHTYKLIITKLDEISVWGNILNISAFAQKPLAYVTVGQNVPQDIEIPDVDGISGRLLEGGGA